MRLIAQKTLNDFAQTHSGAASVLSTFGSIVRAASWTSMDDIVRTTSYKPSPVANDRVVFNIGGNKYRLICGIDFGRGIVFVKWFGTHAEYDKIGAATATNI